MSGDETDYFEVLNHEIRRKIIKLIYERIELSYTEILKTLSISDGLLNFHLRKLEDLIEKTRKGTYILSEKGRRAYIIIRELERLSRSREDTSFIQLNKGVIIRRILAFILDGIIFFLFTGIIFDPVMWGYLTELSIHFTEFIRFHPWIFHWEHLPVMGEIIYRIVSIYAHVFYAIYIFITLVEAYKGQTPGKYVFGIRVIKLSGERLGLIESGIRNAGKIFLLPLDLIIGITMFRKRGFIRFFDYYTDSKIEIVYR